MQRNLEEINELNSSINSNIFKSLSVKSVRIKASIQLRYLKYKLNGYLDSIPTTD